MKPRSIVARPRELLWCAPYGAFVWILSAWISPVLLSMSGSSSNNALELLIALWIVAAALPVMIAFAALGHRVVPAQAAART